MLKKITKKKEETSNAGVFAIRCRYNSLAVTQSFLVVVLP
ncbi:hypothetical protein DOY81_005217 [Sarcophaga bullata]|nr:hypothetical protein DOY81_005217 [Sarcophaga bullata]